jgi:anti-sigma-K factor RskA
MSSEDTEIHDLAAAYALDAVDDDERMAFERHLETCERCRAELASLRETAASLAYAAPPAAPPPELRERILDTARQERPNVVPLRPRRSRTTVALGAATAIAAGVAIALGVWNVSLHNSLDTERSARAATERALVVVGDTAAARHDLSGASGQLVVASSGKAALVLCNLGQAPAGKTYQAWVLSGDKPVSAGVFDSDSGCVAVPLDASVPADTGVAVTVEPDGGSGEPSSTPIFQSMPA